MDVMALVLYILCVRHVTRPQTITFNKTRAVVIGILTFCFGPISVIAWAMMLLTHFMLKEYGK